MTRWITTRAPRCAGRPVLVAVDAEGGKVMRLSPAAGYPRTPTHQELGENNDVAITEARGAADRGAAARGRHRLGPGPGGGRRAQSREHGDRRLRPELGADPARVTAHARAYVDGMHAEGVLTALKHFPGHGSSLADSHLGFVDVTTPPTGRRAGALPRAARRARVDDA